MTLQIFNCHKHHPTVVLALNGQLVYKTNISLQKLSLPRIVDRYISLSLQVYVIIIIIFFLSLFFFFFVLTSSLHCALSVINLGNDLFAKMGCPFSFSLLALGKGNA